MFLHMPQVLERACKKQRDTAWFSLHMCVGGSVPMCQYIGISLFLFFFFFFTITLQNRSWYLFQNQPLCWPGTHANTIVRHVQLGSFDRFGTFNAIECRHSY